MDILAAILTSYAVTVVVCLSHIGDKPREVFRSIVARIPMLRHPFYLDFDFISCRLCVGFWVSLAVTPLYGLALSWIMPVYGAYYFMAMLESE